MDITQFGDYSLEVTAWITWHEWSLYSHCIRGENALAIWSWDIGGKQIKTHSGSKNQWSCSGWRAPMAEKRGLSCCFSENCQKWDLWAHGRYYFLTPKVTQNGQFWKHGIKAKGISFGYIYIPELKFLLYSETESPGAILSCSLSPQLVPLVN